MFQLAVYGKGGIGKSTMSANISLALSGNGHKVMQIGCDPKHDSTRLLLGGRPQATVLDYVREVPVSKRNLEDIVRTGSGGVMCIESGGPEPGIGCAGRGILTSLETLKRLGADDCGADVRLYDVLGDVVCGGFAVPLREEYADGIIIVTSGEFMSLYAANNIMKGIRRFAPERPRLIGLVLNSRGVEGEIETVERFAGATGTRIISVVPRDRRFAEAEASGKTVMEMFPDSDASKAVRRIVDRIEDVMSGAPMDSPMPLDDDQMSDLAAGRPIRGSTRIPVAGPDLCTGCDPSSWTRRQKYSCASCGELMAFARLSDVAVVVHGPASCAYLMDSAYLSTVVNLYSGDVYENPMPDNIYSTRMDESAAIFGGAGRLKDTLEDAYEDGFRELVVLTTCVSGMIGDDCDAVSRMFMAGHPDCEVTVMHPDGVMAGDYYDGMDAAVDSLIEIMEPSEAVDSHTVNVIGSTFFDLQMPDGYRELSRMLGLFGIKLNCRFLDDTTMSSIRGFCSAGLDLMANECGSMEMADRISERTGRNVPRVGIPTGYYEYIQWLDTMVGIYGHGDIVDRERADVDALYNDFIQRNRPLFEGRKVVLSTCIPRNVDWFIDIMNDLGAEVVRLGHLKPDDHLGNVTTKHRDMVIYGYGKEAMAADWNVLYPDLTVYDVDIPEDYPGARIMMTRIGPGIRSALSFVEKAAVAMRTGGSA